MLVRNLRNVSPQPNDGTPMDSNTPPLPLNLPAIYGPNANASIARNFWTDFDYSVYFNNLTGLSRFNFTGIPHDSLWPKDAGGWSPRFPADSPECLGNPACRFGFDDTWIAGINGGNPGPTYGLPREYVTAGLNNYFIGRFTHRETSDGNFGYPGRLMGHKQ